MHSIITYILLFSLIVINSIYGQSLAQFDRVNVDEVLQNDRILTNYIKCLTNKGICTRDGKDLKALLPNILQTDCVKCSALQKRNSKKIVDHIMARRPGDWKQLTSIYDPSGIHKARIEKLVH